MPRSCRSWRAPLLDRAEDAPARVPEAFPLSRSRSEDRLRPGTPGGHGPKRWSRAGPRVAPAGPDRGTDWPRSGEPEAPTSWRLARRRPRQLSAATQRLRILRCDTPAHRRLATARPRDSVGCGGVTTRAPRGSRLVLRGAHRPCHQLERAAGAWRAG